ncbi:zinc finger MYM-type protein 6-like [Aphis craccivora]|uniref:Zinc finger MYM-type protein 6-like n=1 Tax=Aphis craccivora TaxID=307492 RepID=A0A6G0Z1W3_APHCR|nr:zinc finger MYM-type protein 6-like [Aphis craccivora]
MWAHGIQIWGVTKSSNPRTIQALHSIGFRKIVSASSWYIKNADPNRSLNILTESQLIKSHFLLFCSKLIHHKNPLINQLSST